MEDRMLSDEILLGIINSKSGGGGGGGTDDYNDLKNQPQINGNTLVGNKSASDLGLVAAENGKGLSSNDYTNEDKAIVGGVTAALAGKQNALTAGKYIDIDANNEISVEREIPDESFTYTIQQIGDGIVKITKTVNGAVVFEETYNGNASVTLDALQYVYNNGIQSYTLLIASDTHEAGFKQSMNWWGRETYTENFSTVDHSGEKLIIKSELDAALDGKQDATDNSLETEAKTIVGAINEHEGDIGSLKSGLTNYERDNNWRVEAPERKNHYDPNSDRLMYDTSHAWWLDSSVNKIASGGNTNYTWAVKCDPNTAYTVSLTHTSTTFRVAYGKMENLAWVTTDDTSKDIYGLQSNSETGDVSITITTGSDATYLFIQIGSSDVDTAKLTMQVEIGDTATTFAPYIPSIESRLEALEVAIAHIANG